MKQKAGVILIAIVVIGLLALLSAANYSHKEKLADKEDNANRSTYNSGATGTQAFYTLLNETGRRVVRWQQPPQALLTAREKDRPQVLVIVGYVHRPFTKEESASLLQWVSDGGRLVLVDRQPDEGLIATTALWKLDARAPIVSDIFDIDPTDQTAMTDRTPAVKPVQPSVFTEGINAVQPSKFAGNVTLTRQDSSASDDEVRPSGRGGYKTAVVPPADYAPSVHLASSEKNFLVDAPYGNGRIILLTDPYIVSNAGIGLVDNARLAANLVMTNGGVIAFDEYHQGYGADSNRLLQFFAGTPVVAIFLQLLVVVAVVFFSQSRRFARPLPEPEPDRLSKLEYISAMAELQHRTRAYDLAVENIYSDVRRRVARGAGLDALRATSHELAVALAGNTDEAQRIEKIFFQCEEVIRGGPVGQRAAIRLVEELRVVESKYNLRRRDQT